MTYPTIIRNTRGPIARRCLVHGAPSREGCSRHPNRDSCRVLRATGITNFLTNGAKFEIAQPSAGNANIKTTQCYDRAAKM